MDMTLKIIFRFVYIFLGTNALPGLGPLDKEVMFDKLVEIIDTDILLVTDKMHKNSAFQPPIGGSLEEIFRNRLDLFIGVPKELLVTGLDLEDGDLSTVDQLFLSCLSNATRANNNGLSSAVPTATPVESASTNCHTTENPRQRNAHATPDNVAVTVAPQTNVTATTVWGNPSIPSTAAQLAFGNPIKRSSGEGIDGSPADGHGDRKSTATTTRSASGPSTAAVLPRTGIVRSTVSPKHQWVFGDDNTTMTTTVVTPPIKIHDSARSTPK